MNNCFSSVGFFLLCYSCLVAIYCTALMLLWQVFSPTWYILLLLLLLLPLDTFVAVVVAASDFVFVSVAFLPLGDGGVLLLLLFIVLHYCWYHFCDCNSRF